MRAPDAGTPQRELQPATIREMPGDSPNNGELAPLYRINDSVARHYSIAFRPAAVIWRRTTSTGLAPAFMVSRSAVAPRTF